VTHTDDLSRFGAQTVADTKPRRRLSDTTAGY
jgi:hypothetical protein